MTLNCIAVDDEPLALRLIDSFMEKTPFLNNMGTYPSAIEALKAIDHLDVHLIFLDIQMPDLTGMQFSRLLSKIKDRSKCRIVFTTAYNQFAIEGYQVDALYYLLKPFNYAEFLEAATKAKTYFEQMLVLAPIVRQAEEKDRRERYLFLKADYKLVRIDFDHIRYIESYKDYIKVYTTRDDKPILSLNSLKSIMSKLPADEFMRIHRSFLVSIARIDAIGRNGVYIGGEHIPAGDQYKDEFKQLLDRWH